MAVLSVEVPLDASFVRNPKRQQAPSGNTSKSSESAKCEKGDRQTGDTQRAPDGEGAKREARDGEGAWLTLCL